MARDASTANWRLLRRVVDVLDANMTAQVAAVAALMPSGLNVTAPASEAYYVLPSIEAVRENLDRNHFVQVYVCPSSDRSRNPRTGTGPGTKSHHSFVEVTVAIRVLEEAGAADVADTWKTLTPREREFARCETLLGAALDCLEGNIRDGDDSLQVDFVDSRSGDTRFRRSGTDTHDGTWASLRMRCHQVISVQVQTS
jgi:hypothetical protein